MVTGTITPSGSKSVVLQAKVGQTWSDRQGGAVSSTGTFSITIRPRLRGLYTFRVRSSGGSVVSPTIYLRVNPPVIHAASGKGVFYAPMFAGSIKLTTITNCTWTVEVRAA